MKTTFPVSASAEAWAALADPQRLAASLPGCRSVVRDADGDGTLQVVTEVAVASVRGLWAGTVTPVDADAVRVRGSGAPGAVDLVVRANTERTALTVEGTVGGALGTVGSALLAAAVRQTAHDLLTAATEAGPGPGALEPDVGVAVAATTLVPGDFVRRAVPVTAVATGILVAIVVGSRRRRAQRGGS